MRHLRPAYQPFTGQAVVDERNGRVCRVLVDVEGLAWVRPLLGGPRRRAVLSQLRKARHDEVSREWTGRTR